MERRGTPVTSLIADGVAESAAAQSAAEAASPSADPFELDDTGVRAGSAGGGDSGGGAAPAPAGGDGEEVGEEGEVGEVAEVGEGPRDPRRPWAGTKPALKPLDGITDEQASMLVCRLGGATACYPRPTGMRGSGSRLLCSVSQPLSAQWERQDICCCCVTPSPTIMRLSTRSQARRIREAVRKNKRRSRQDGG